MWKIIRVIILLLILAKALQQTVLEESDLDWKTNFYVAVYPINADNSSEVNTYIKGLEQSNFEPVAEYFAEEAQRYNLHLRRPIEVVLADEIKEIPPAPPQHGNMFAVMLWSLKFRFYAWKHNPTLHIKPSIKLYLLYHDPEKTMQLTHSTALYKGRIGRVNLFASSAYEKKNLVVLSHELLHTVKATDKYDNATNLPLYPEGFAEPQKLPLYPQRFAEIMGGRVSMSAQQAEMPNGLKQTLIGDQTAREIGWLK
jgi:hypothetical protein